MPFESNDVLLPAPLNPSSHCSACSACGSDHLTPFYSVEATPVTCASVFDSAARAQAVPVGQVQLSICDDCGMVFNTVFDERLADVGAQYESAQGASAHFSQFAQSLAQRWIRDHRLQGQTVMEIGCGDGAFLKLMLSHGVTRAIGFDPVVAPERLLDESLPPEGVFQTGSEPVKASTSPTLILRAERFSATTLHVDAQAAVCRHTLEHVADVGGFLRLLAQWARQAPGRVVLFEVPATERVLSECAFWDVYYEHCSYFTASSLRHAFESAGFEVTRLESVYNDQYLVLEAVPAVVSPGPSSQGGEAQVVRSHCLQFAAQAHQTIARCDHALQALAARGRPVVLWQAASKTVGFISALSNASLIHSAVDLNPRRWGQFLPGSGLPIHTPMQLQTIQPAYVVLMNPVYVDEVQAQLTEMGVKACLLTINDLCEGQVSGLSVSEVSD